MWEKIHWALHYVGVGALPVLPWQRWILPCGIWKAKRQNLPLWQALGGNDPKVLAYTGGIDLQIPLEELLEGATRQQAASFCALKMKIGYPQLGQDVTRVGVMRQHVGEGLPLMVDAQHALGA